MWTLMGLATAFAAEQPAPPPEAITLDALEWQIQDEVRWRRIDLDSTELARTAGILSVAGPLALGAGIGLAALGSSADLGGVTGAGVLLGIAGGAATLVGPPLMFAGSLRANTALRERGVFVSTTGGVTGWTLYGSTIFVLPLFVQAWPLAPLWYAGLVGAGYAQIETNRRGREASGLDVHVPLLSWRVVPRLDGFAVVGRF